MANTVVFSVSALVGPAIRAEREPLDAGVGLPVLRRHAGDPAGLVPDAALRPPCRLHRRWCDRHRGGPARHLRHHPRQLPALLRRGPALRHVRGLRAVLSLRRRRRGGRGPGPARCTAPWPGHRLGDGRRHGGGRGRPRAGQGHPRAPPALHLRRLLRRRRGAGGTLGRGGLAAPFAAACPHAGRMRAAGRWP